MTNSSAPKKILFLPDTETAVDLLYFEPIATALTNLINDTSEKPITIGVHGDWGAGKSSIMQMVQAQLSTRDDVLVIHFDGWRFQGFDDAKTVLLETIVEELKNSKKFGSKIKDEAKDLLKRVKWLKIAKKAGEVGLNYFGGIPTPGQIKDAFSQLSALAKNSTDNVTGDQITGALSSVSEYLDEKQDETVVQNIHEFIQGFQDLLKKTGLKKLVVLIDDLDRCLPETTIQTLEAIRLFLFVERTAFVIAADEGMIEYAVRNHFPDLPASTTSTSYARNYLEKLIQTPIRLSPLGVEEAKVYVTLLLVQSIAGEDHSEFKKLIVKARDLMRQPWVSADLKIEDVQAIDSSKREELTAAYQLALQIGRPVAEGTSGNPRQIKRFLNGLAVRQTIANARGLETIVKRDILAKLMLLERFRPELYNTFSLMALKSPTGIVLPLTELEKEAVKPAEELQDDLKPTKYVNPEMSEWITDSWLNEWAQIQPPLSKVDLRPYVFVARDKKVQLGKASISEAVSSILEAVSGGSMALAGAETTIKTLPPEEVETVFNELKNQIFALSDLKQKPDAFDGLCRLVQYHPQLHLKFVTLLEDLDDEAIGTWAAAGWRPEAWTSEIPKARALKLLRLWASSSNKQLKAVAGSLVKRVGGE